MTYLYIVIGLLFIGMGVWGIKTYNFLKLTEVVVNELWESAYVFLKRRYDLIPEFVSLAKTDIGKDLPVFASLLSLRIEAAKCNDLNKLRAIEDKISSRLVSVIELVKEVDEEIEENNLREIWQLIMEAENNAQGALFAYNQNISEVNALISVMPNSILAPLMGIKERQYMEIQMYEDLIDLEL